MRPLRQYLIVVALTTLLTSGKGLSQEPKKVEPVPPYSGRTGAAKEGLLKEFGGDAETEAAVARGLAWLAKNQKEDGSWAFDGKAKEHAAAATGLALLPFLGAGETPKDGKRYKQVVDKGLKYLLSKQTDEGTWEVAELEIDGKKSRPSMYVHALATLALCEAAGMTGDEALKAAATKAVHYTVKAQAKNGSWGYTPGVDGNTSITGWQMQALQEARRAGIAVPAKAFEGAESFLRSVSIDGSDYGYRAKASTTLALNASGLLCRQFMGWTPRESALAKGVSGLVRSPGTPSEKNWDMYYYYYATQVVYFFGGPAWKRDWNVPMRALLLKKQVTAKTPKANPRDVGSWPKDDASIGTHCGRLGTTALAVLTLEVYYRHLPLARDRSLVEPKKD